MAANTTHTDSPVSRCHIPSSGVTAPLDPSTRHWRPTGKPRPPAPAALSPRHPQLTPSQGCCSTLSVAQAGPPRLLQLLLLLYLTSTQSGSKPGSSFRTHQDLITPHHLPCPSHMGIKAPAPHGPSRSHMTCPQQPQTSFPNVWAPKSWSQECLVVTRASVGTPQGWRLSCRTELSLE